jgi:hypothetical protein
MISLKDISSDISEITDLTRSRSATDSFLKRREGWMYSEKQRAKEEPDSCNRLCLSCEAYSSCTRPEYTP